MELKKVHVIELIAGLALIILGLVVYWWASQLFWILIYPPPILKIIIDILPFILWLIGVVLILDSIRRIRAESSSKKE